MESQAITIEPETRQRLLHAAARLFAERGFHQVTIRDICNEAGANIAAVNYYFRDKLGLYEAVIDLVAEGMDRMKREALDSGEGKSPEEQLRAYIHSTLSRVFSSSHEAIPGMDRLVGREMMEPTPAFARIVEKGIKPTAGRLAAMVGQLLGCPANDPRVWQCVLSVQAQWTFYHSAKAVFAHMAPGFSFTPEVIASVADHITEFSLAGIRAIAQKKVEASQWKP